MSAMNLEQARELLAKFGFKRGELWPLEIEVAESFDALCDEVGWEAIHQTSSCGYLTLADALDALQTISLIAAAHQTSIKEWQSQYQK